MEFKSGPKPSSPDMLHPGQGATFEEFLPFVQVQDPKLKEKFIRVLRKIFLVSGNMWNPGSCQATTELKRIIETVKKQGDLADVEFTPMAFGRIFHFFITAKFTDSDQVLVIDPFGVPPPGTKDIDYIGNNRLITPFFGEMELAPSKHKSVYTQAQPGNVRYFHP